MNRSILDGKPVRCVVTLAAIGAAGCTNELADDREVIPESRALAAPPLGGNPGVGAVGNTANPEGSYVADVTALGTGCPPGTSSTVISANGELFTTTFSSYETYVFPQLTGPATVKDCQLSIRLHSPQGLSFAVSSFSYSGSATLDPGVTATLTAHYYFQGQPVPASDSNREVLSGPMNRLFSFTDEVRTSDQVWSPCGAVRNLQILTRLVVSHGHPSGNGIVRVATVDGNTALRFGISWRRCR